MPLRDDILKPIDGDNPGGQDLRYDPIYDKIKEARREDDQLAQGAWQRERKLADYSLVIKLTQDAIATQSKDLQLAAWLTEALLRRSSFAGLRDGLILCGGLVGQFWDHLYPALDDGDMEFRAAPLDWIATKLESPIKTAPLCRDGYGLYAYTDSRKVAYEDQAKTKEQKAARDAALKEGKIQPEVFDKSFTETPKAFYAQTEKELDGSLEALAGLDEVCRQKFADTAPSFGKLKSALEEVRHAVHGFLQKKRETEPDPVEEAPPQPAADADGPTAGDQSPAAAFTTGSVFTVPVAAEPAERREAIANIAAAAAFLRKLEPRSPAPYLMMRGLRWGELRASSDPSALQAPPMEVRQQIKTLALQNRWRELLETAEHVMALPCSRAWLDLQRFVVEACVALGPEYEPIAIAIRSELRALLRDLPPLLDATLSDDTPVANPQTQAWLRELMAEPAAGAPSNNSHRPPIADDPQEPGWQKKFIDPHMLASEALRQGQPQKALEIMNKEIERQRSGRGRFQRKLQLAQLCIAAGKDGIAQPLLDDISALIETHKLEDWEDREMIAGVLLFLLQSNKKIQADAKVKQALFDRICRLDPVRALSV